MTPGIRFVTVLDALVRLTPSTVRLAFDPVTAEV